MSTLILRKHVLLSEDITQTSHLKCVLMTEMEHLLYSHMGHGAVHGPKQQ